MKNLNKETKYWLDHSIYDFDTAKAMLKSRRYLYVAFMCQQAVEKFLKGIITLVSKITPPRSHDLLKLAVIARIEDKLTGKQKEFLNNLTPYCIITRYAGYKKKLSELCNKKMATIIFGETGEFLKWLKREVNYLK